MNIKPLIAKIMKKTIFILTALIFTAAIFSSCNELKKMVKEADDVSYRTNPSPLEMHADQVAINVSVSFPEKYFGKKVKLVITPTLVQDEGDEQVKFPTQTIIGEKFQDNYPIIPYKEGGTYKFADTIDYNDAFRMSDLNLEFQLSDQKSRSADLVSVKLADGIITTAELVEAGIAVDNGLEDGNTLGQPVIVPVEKPTISYNTKMAKIYFDLQKANVKRGELSKEEMKELIQYIKETSDDPNQELAKLSIASHASPDGPIDLNESLVSDRGSNTKSAFARQLKQNGVEGVDVDEFIATETTPSEDWEGFKELVEASDMEDKDLILKVLSMYDDPVKREEEIKNMAAVYDELRQDILPLLRRSIIKLQYQGREKDASEIISLGSSKPDSLSEQELLFAGYKTEDLDKKEEVYKNYTEKYPENWKGWNNLAVAQAENGKLDEAKANFEKVLELNENNPAALNNLGAIAMAEKDWDAAWEYFEQAEEAGCKSPAMGYNMGAIHIMRAEYDQAVQRFDGNSFNLALAQTLNTDNDAAVSTLNAMSNDKAMFYYLKAVTAAKAENEGDALENLRIAISKKEALKEYAANDLEFRNYFDTQDFKDIVK
jgi:tetratricopeptide (TPR) repeat protein